MKDLDRALADITAIRSQLARGTEFRGYGPVTVAATGVLALLAAAAAGALSARSGRDAARLSGAVGRHGGARRDASPAPRWSRARAAMHGGLADEMLYAAVEQFIPAGVAGTLLTVVLYRFAPDALWMLPGPVADHVQPRRVRLVPRRCRAACSRSASGISRPASSRSRLRAARRSRPGDGDAVRHRPVPDGVRALARDRRRTMAKTSARPSRALRL